VAAPGVVVDVFGFSLASGDQIRSTVREFARTADLMVLDAIATGSGVLVVREPAGVTVLTDLAGVWPVFYATVGDSVVYSSSASAVARYVGSEVDEQWLAARLLAGGIPDAWSEGSPYRRVAAVPAGGVLLIYPSGRSAVVRRELPLGTAEFDEGTQRLAEALTSVVRGRTTACHELSTDLSGGLDSSTVAALAAATRPDRALPAITLVCTDLGSDDPAHARRVAVAVPGITHVELPLPGEVEPYAALTEMPRTDESFADVSIFARLRWWMTIVRELGGQAHLTGDGGDAVLTAPLAYLADLAQRRGFRELWSHAAGWARLRHRPLHRLVGAARRLAGTTQASAIEHYANALEREGTGAPSPRRWEDLIAWAPPPPCPQWFTPHARELAATALRNAFRGPGDRATPGDVASLGMVQAYGRAHRIHLELAAGLGVALHAPYLDDAVVAACLAVPAEQRTSPWQAKPLLRAAMTGRVPDAALVRSTKGDYSMLAYRGLSRHHRTVADLLTNSRLAGLGLIEEKAIRADLRAVPPGCGSRWPHWTGYSAPRSGCAPVAPRPSPRLIVGTGSMRSYLPRESVHLAPTTSGALVLLDTRSGRMFQLDPTGASAWNALVVGGGDVQAAARTLAQRYGQPYLRALDDLWPLIQRLVEVNLLEATR
jgi:asparagine synthase (glutamine-hydrolysing)